MTESTRVAIDAPVYTLRIHYPDGRDDMVKTRTAGDTLVEPRIYSMGIKTVTVFAGLVMQNGQIRLHFQVLCQRKIWIFTWGIPTSCGMICQLG